MNHFLEAVFLIGPTGVVVSAIVYVIIRDEKPTNKQGRKNNNNNKHVR